MSFTLSVKRWSVFLWFLHPVTIVGLYYCVMLHRVPRVGLCSNISYTMYHGLSVFVRLETDRVSEVCPCLCVS